MERCNIRNTEPSTSSLRLNEYHLNINLFVLDVIRLFQDHPKYKEGLKENHIVNLYEKKGFSTGDIEAQVKMALKELTSCGFVRHINHGYRTIGPFAKLALARTPRQLSLAWERLDEMQKISNTRLSSGSSSQSNTSV